MFFTLILENETGQQIDLSKTANRFMFPKIEGLNPPAGTISTSSYAGMDAHGVCPAVGAAKCRMSIPEQSGDSFDICVLFRVYFTGKGADSYFLFF